MKATIRMKYFLAAAMYHLGLISLKLRRAPDGAFIILMYHRIIARDEARNGVQAGMYVEPGTLERQLRFLKRYFVFCPLEEVFDGSQRKVRAFHDRPSCVLTFDDGWADFYTNCFPILKAYGVPATIFLPTHFIGSQDSFWTDRLSDLFFRRWRESKAGRGQLRAEEPGDPLVQRLMRLDGSRESRLESAIALLKSQRNEEIERIITALATEWRIEPNPPGRLFLSWGEVKEMGQSGLITFGSHTATHRILTTLSKEEVKEELVKSREELTARKAVDPAFIPFSYPNGNHTEDICRTVRDTGYHLAVTTKKGWNTRGADASLYKRFPIHQDMTFSPAMLGCRIAQFF